LAKRQTQALISPAALADRASVSVLDKAASSINEFEKALGGRTALVDALCLDATKDIRELVVNLLDPALDKLSLGVIAERTGVTMTDLMRAFRNATLARAQILAAREIAQYLPAVVEDVMKRAAPYKETCEACEGTGTMTVRPTKKVPIPDPATVTCTICRGKKEILRVPELDRQRLALEVSELLKAPGRGPTFLQQINIPAASSGNEAGSLERMQQAVSKVLYSDPLTIDVTPVEETPV
jgi:hypothetical protein